MPRKRHAAAPFSGAEDAEQMIYDAWMESNGSLAGQTADLRDESSAQAW